MEIQEIKALDNFSQTKKLTVKIYIPKPHESFVEL